MNFRVLIPARHDASRLPGKPLVEIAGKPLILHVCERALESAAAEVWVATDDERIAAACTALEVRVAMTSPAHASGTDRIAEVAAREGWDENDILVDLQGDEPLMPPTAINTVAEALAADPEAGLSTLAARLYEAERFRDPNVVKVVVNAQGRALFFSRAPIPWPRNAGLDIPREVLRHIGIYGFRVGVLRRLANEAPCALEQTEALEQLRALWLGLSIRVAVIDDIPSASVDTAADVERVAMLLKTAVQR